MQRPWLAALVLFVGTALLYSPSLRFGFTIDDPLVTTANSEVRGFRGDCLPFFERSYFSGTKYARENGDLYRPVTKCTFALDYLLNGRSFDPGPFHRTNVILYGICVVLVFLLAGSLLPSNRRTGFGVAFAAALLFAVLPSHLESVCNVKHREEILACCFGIASWLAVLRGPRTGMRSILTAVVAALLFLLALLCKESIILLYPCMILWDAPRLRSDLLRPTRWPAYVWSVAAVIFVYFVLRANALGAVLSPAGTRPFFPENIGPASRVLISSTTFLKYYLWDQLITQDLSPAFSTPFLIMAGDRPGFVDGVAAVVLLGIGAASMWHFWTRRSIGSFAILFVLITSLLTFHFVPIGTAGAFRLAFTPSVGLCLLVALTVRGLAAGSARGAGLGAGYETTGFCAAMVLIALCYGYVTWTKMPIWTDDGRLFAYAAEAAPADPVSAAAAAQHFGATGDLERQKYFLEQAVRRFRSFEDQPHLFDERALDAYSIVATELAHSEIDQGPERAIELSNLAIHQFERLEAARGGAIDTNATAPYYVKALALNRLGRVEESVEVCRAGLAVAYHAGLDRLLRQLTPD